MVCICSANPISPYLFLCFAGVPLEMKHPLSGRMCKVVLIIVVNGHSPSSVTQSSSTCLRRNAYAPKLIPPRSMPSPPHTPSPNHHSPQSYHARPPSSKTPSPSPPASTASAPPPRYPFFSPSISAPRSPNSVGSEIGTGLWICRSGVL